MTKKLTKNGIFDKTYDHYDHFMTIFKNYIQDDHNIKDQIIQ